MVTGTAVVDIGWDLSTRAQSKRTLVMNNIWLRGKEAEVLKEIFSYHVNSILGIRLEGNSLGVPS